MPNKYSGAHKDEKEKKKFITLRQSSFGVMLFVDHCQKSLCFSVYVFAIAINFNATI